jgi:hypothetical protein
MKESFYIFLDIDGVLAGHDYIKKLTDSGQRAKGGLIKELDPECIDALNFFIFYLSKKYEVDLVISSTWRSDLEDTIEILKFHGLKYDKEITRTGVIDFIRGLEVLDYLKNKKNNNNYVVIDDDSFDIAPYIPHSKIIKTSLHKPLSIKHVKQHLKELNILTTEKEYNRIL